MYVYRPCDLAAVAERHRYVALRPQLPACGPDGHVLVHVRAIQQGLVLHDRFPGKALRIRYPAGLLYIPAVIASRCLEDGFSAFDEIDRNDVGRVYVPADRVDDVFQNFLKVMGFGNAPADRADYRLVPVLLRKPREALAELFDEVPLVRNVAVAADDSDYFGAGTLGVARVLEYPAVPELYELVYRLLGALLEMSCRPADALGVLYLREKVLYKQAEVFRRRDRFRNLPHFDVLPVEARYPVRRVYGDNAVRRGVERGAEEGERMFELSSVVFLSTDVAEYGREHHAVPGGLPGD